MVEKKLPETPSAIFFFFHLLLPLFSLNFSLSLFRAFLSSLSISLQLIRYIYPKKKKGPDRGINPRVRLKKVGPRINSAFSKFKVGPRINSAFWIKRLRPRINSAFWIKKSRPRINSAFRNKKSGPRNYSAFWVFLKFQPGPGYFY